MIATIYNITTANNGTTKRYRLAASLWPDYLVANSNVIDVHLDKILPNDTCYYPTGHEFTGNAGFLVSTEDANLFMLVTATYTLLIVDTAMHESYVRDLISLLSTSTCIRVMGFESAVSAFEGTAPHSSNSTIVKYKNFISLMSKKKIYQWTPGQVSDLLDVVNGLTGNMRKISDNLAANWDDHGLMKRSIGQLADNNNGGSSNAERFSLESLRALPDDNTVNLGSTSGSNIGGFVFIDDPLVAHVVTDLGGIRVTQQHKFRSAKTAVGTGNYTWYGVGLDDEDYGTPAQWGHQYVPIGQWHQFDKAWYGTSRHRTGTSWGASAFATSNNTDAHLIENSVMSHQFYCFGGGPVVLTNARVLVVWSGSNRDSNEIGVASVYNAGELYDSGYRIALVGHSTFGNATSEYTSVQPSGLKSTWPPDESFIRSQEYYPNTWVRSTLYASAILFKAPDWLKNGDLDSSENLLDNFEFTRGVRLLGRVAYFLENASLVGEANRILDSVVGRSVNNSNVLNDQYKNASYRNAWASDELDRHFQQILSANV